MTKGPILVIDDDRIIRETLRTILEEEGYCVEIAENGVEALAMLRTTAPRAIVLDLRMPVMDGWTFARELRAQGYATPIVVVTAAHDALRGADDVGAVAILPKPFEIDDLVQEVERLCGAA